MALLMRNDAKRRAARNVEQMNLGHADLRNECWSGTSAIVSSTLRTGLAAPRRASDARRGSVRRYISRDRHNGRKRDSSWITGEIPAD